MWLKVPQSLCSFPFVPVARFIIHPTTTHASTTSHPFPQSPKIISTGSARRTANQIRDLDGNLLEFEVSSPKLLLVLQSMNIMDMDKGTSNAVAVEGDGGIVV